MKLSNHILIIVLFLMFLLNIENGNFISYGLVIMYFFAK
jgi:hypothetical protein